MMTGENKITSINSTNRFIKSTKLQTLPTHRKYSPIGKARASHPTKWESSDTYK